MKNNLLVSVVGLVGLAALVGCVAYFTNGFKDLSKLTSNSPIATSDNSTSYTPASIDNETIRSTVSNSETSQSTVNDVLQLRVIPFQAILNIVDSKSTAYSEYAVYHVHSEEYTMRYGLDILTNGMVLTWHRLFESDFEPTNNPTIVVAPGEHVEYAYLKVKGFDLDPLNVTLTINNVTSSMAITRAYSASV